MFFINVVLFILFFFNVVLELCVGIDYTGPETDNEDEFTVQHPSQCILKKIHGDKFRTYKLRSLDKFRHFPKHRLFGHQNSSSTVACYFIQLSINLFIQQVFIDHRVCASYCFVIAP